MNILIVAPQPFFQERGTPIAVDLLIRALSEQGHTLDLLAFDEGEDRQHPNLTIHRVTAFPSITGVKPGFSLKKLYLDVWLLFKLIKMLIKKRYDVVHAVEESAFFAMLLRPFFGYRYVYDMDSSIATQLVDKCPMLTKAQGLFKYLELLPARFADRVVPCCNALANDVYQYRTDGVFVLHDIDMSRNPESIAYSKQATEDFRTLFDNPQHQLFMYIGNLKSYQGIDLLLNSFAAAIQKQSDVNLLIIGGEPYNVKKYQTMSQTLGIDKQTVFVGKRPIQGLLYYMNQADVLISPRSQGVNTPMKIYSYLASGKTVLATKMLTHTQLMNDEIAVLANPTVNDFSTAMQKLISQPQQYKQRAEEATKFIDKHHSYTTFYSTVEKIYIDLLTNSDGR